MNIFFPGISHWLILTKHISNKLNSIGWFRHFLTINYIGWFKLNIFLTSNSTGWFKLNVFLTSDSIRCIRRVASFHPMFQTAASWTVMSQWPWKTSWSRHGRRTWNPQESCTLRRNHRPIPGRTLHLGWPGNSWFLNYCFQEHI